MKSDGEFPYRYVYVAAYENDFHVHTPFQRRVISIGCLGAINLDIPEGQVESACALMHCEPSFNAPTFKFCVNIITVIKTFVSYDDVFAVRRNRALDIHSRAYSELNPSTIIPLAEFSAPTSDVWGCAMSYGCCCYDRMQLFLSMY